MARCHYSLMCSPQPVARVLRALPKLAVVFLVIHVVVMIYSILNRSPQVSKKSIIEEKAKNHEIVHDSFGIKGNLSSNNFKRVDRAEMDKKINRDSKRLRLRNKKVPMEEGWTPQ